MKIEFSNNFTRDIRRLRDQSIKERIRTAIEQIEQVNDLTEASNVRKISGFENCFRVRVGNYRLGFRLDKNTVIFFRCLPRRDFYQRFP